MMLLRIKGAGLSHALPHRQCCKPAWPRFVFFSLVAANGSDGLAGACPEWPS